MQGIEVLDADCKTSQDADDTTFILDESQSSLSRSLYPLDTFARIKSYGLAPVNVWHKSSSRGNPVHANFSEKIDKPQSIVNSWSARRLTLLGRINI